VKRLRGQRDGLHDGERISAGSASEGRYKFD
jgi:hypothetical protein